MTALIRSPSLRSAGFLRIALCAEESPSSGPVVLEVDVGQQIVDVGVLGRSRGAPARAPPAPAPTRRCDAGGGPLRPGRWRRTAAAPPTARCRCPRRQQQQASAGVRWPAAAVRHGRSQATADPRWRRPPWRTACARRARPRVAHAGSAPAATSTQPIVRRRCTKPAVQRAAAWRGRGRLRPRGRAAAAAPPFAAAVAAGAASPGTGASAPTRHDEIVVAAHDRGRGVDDGGSGARGGGRRRRRRAPPGAPRLAPRRRAGSAGPPPRRARGVGAGASARALPSGVASSAAASSAAD